MLKKTQKLEKKFHFVNLVLFALTLALLSNCGVRRPLVWKGKVEESKMTISAK